jgi:uncharacterized protein YdcH (DUF465 family)
MYERRIKHLEEAHRAIDKQIETLERTGNFTDQRLTDLKKHKLTLKDEIVILKQKQLAHDNKIIQSCKKI